MKFRKTLYQSPILIGFSSIQYRRWDFVSAVHLPISNEMLIDTLKEKLVYSEILSVKFFWSKISKSDCKEFDFELPMI